MLDYKVVDLRSDTITKPTKEMMLAMCEYYSLRNANEAVLIQWYLSGSTQSMDIYG